MHGAIRTDQSFLATYFSHVEQHINPLTQPGPLKHTHTHTLVDLLSFSQKRVIFKLLERSFAPHRGLFNL